MYDNLRFCAHMMKWQGFAEHLFSPMIKDTDRHIMETVASFHLNVSFGASHPPCLDCFVDLAPQLELYYHSSGWEVVVVILMTGTQATMTLELNVINIVLYCVHTIDLIFQ
jgi:hypothetical protein